MLQQRMAEAVQNLPNTLSPMEPSSEFTLEAVEPHLKNIHPDDFDKKLTDIMCTFLTREYEQTIQTIFERFRYSNVNRRCPDTQKSILSTAIDNELSSTFIHRLLLNNADPCLADPDGQIMLTKFIRRKLDKEYIQRLSYRCIDTPDKHGRLPLWWAVEVFCKDYVLQHVHGARKLVSGLLHQARAADDKGITPLMIASSYKSKNMVAALLADVHGPCASDVDAVCKHGKTALIYAVSSSDNFANTKAIIQQLLSAGANSSITDDTGKSAAEYCPNKLVYLITSRKKQNGSK
jgi:ankyrin repeat protein